MYAPSNSDVRGVSASFHEPVGQEQLYIAAEATIQRLQSHNPNIVFRNSINDVDIKHPLYCWTHASEFPYEEIFQSGFQTSNEIGIDESLYFDLSRYINAEDHPGRIGRKYDHPFVSTTMLSSWSMPVPTWMTSQGPEKLYRYEIYAPGGINVRESLEDDYLHDSREEIVFVGGIAPQYIRCVQTYWVGHRRDRSAFYEPEDLVITNGNFNPHPSGPIELVLPGRQYMYRDASRTLRRGILHYVEWEPALQRLGL